MAAPRSEVHAELCGPARLPRQLQILVRKRSRSVRQASCLDSLPDMKAETILLCVALASCNTNVFGPDLQFSNRRLLDPLPDWYATEYALMEECVGRRGDFAAVRWYIADVVILGSARLAGAVQFPHDITLAAYSYSNPLLVRHEAEHHIRQRGDDIHLPNGETPCQAYLTS
jgi:hypothetical protein